MNGNLTAIDYVVLGVYLVATLAIGVLVSRRVASGNDLFLAGRRLPWWAIGFSLVATDIGGTDIIGVGGAAYSHGLAVANFEWIGCVPAMIVAALVFIPLFWRSGVTTVPEFLERRYNAAVRTAVALCWIVFMASNLGIMLYASSSMMTELFGWSPPFSIALMAVLVGVYTCFGGLAAVVYTDVVQCIVMIGGCLLVLAIGLWEVGGVDNLIEKVHEGIAQRQSAMVDFDSSRQHEHTSLILPVDTQTPFPWTGILFGLSFVLGPAYWIGNQAIVQRSLGARTEFEAKAAYVWGALLKNVIPVVVAVPGLIALAKFPALENGDQAIPVLVSKLLPVGVRGMFLAAFLAALMSSVDSYLNAAAALVTTDVYQRWIAPQANDRQLLRVGRLSTVALMLSGTAFGYYLLDVKGGGVYDIFQTLMAFFQGPSLAILLTGVFWRRATGRGAFVGFVWGVLTALLLFALNYPLVYEWLGFRPLFQIQQPYLYFSVWAFLVSLVTTCVVSLYTRLESGAKIAPYVFDSAAPVHAAWQGIKRLKPQSVMQVALLAAVLALAWLLIRNPMETPLHTAGEFIRRLFLAIPLTVARGLFLGLLIYVALWVWRRPGPDLLPADTVAAGANLKVWALVALGIQIAIYAVV